jgi:hypothetical protein
MPQASTLSSTKSGLPYGTLSKSLVAFICLLSIAEIGKKALVDRQFACLGRSHPEAAAAD